MVLKYSHIFKAMNRPIGAKIKNAMKELNNVKNIPPRGETKNATIPKNVSMVDVSSFNSELLLLLPPSPPGGKNIDSADDDVDVENECDSLFLIESRNVFD